MLFIVFSYMKHDKTKCKHCLGQKKSLESQKSLKAQIALIKLPKIERKTTFVQSAQLKQTPQKRASFVEKLNEEIKVTRTPEKIASPTIKGLNFSLP